MDLPALPDSRSFGFAGAVILHEEDYDNWLDGAAVDDICSLATRPRQLMAQAIDGVIAAQEPKVLSGK